MFGPLRAVGMPTTHKPTHNIADAGYGPCCYARIPCASVKRSRSRIDEGPYRKQNLKLNPGLLWKLSKGFSKGMFKLGTDLIQFLFTERPLGVLMRLFFVQQRPCLSRFIYGYMNSFYLAGTATS
jgi:hypothetical protein